MALLALGLGKMDFDAVGGNPLFAASAEVVGDWEAYLDGVRKAGSSIGAVVALAEDR